jgi:hypothetical protein
MRSRDQAPLYSVAEGMHTRRMKKRPTARDWLPLSGAARVAGGIPAGEAFRSEWIDFDRGIRVRNLEPHERITQILKHGLQSRYGAGFINDRWGHGVFWQNTTC